MVEKGVKMQFRVSAVRRDALKAEAARRGKTLTELFEEQMGPLWGDAGGVPVPPEGSVRPVLPGRDPEAATVPEVGSRRVPTVAEVAGRTGFTEDVAERVLKWGGASWDGDVLVVNGRRY